MKEISIIAATFIGNRGAEAMLTTVIGEIRKKNKDTVFNVFSYYPKNDASLVKDPNIKVYNSTPLYLALILFPFSILFRFVKIFKLKFLESFFPQAIVSMANSVVILDLAGVSFIDSRLKYLPFNIFTIWPAIILGVPVVKMAQAMGTFKKPINRLASLFFLSHCHKIFARGKQTLEYLKDLNISSEKYELSTDVALLQENGYSVTNENTYYFQELMKKINILSSNNKIIGICPSSLIYKLEKNNGEDNYSKTMIALTNELIKQKYIVVYFPNATMPNNFAKFRNNDLAVINEIKSSLLKDGASEKIIFIDHCINTDQIKKIINSCTLTIVSRFHAMIASLTIGVPTVVMGWSHKYHEIMSEFNQGDLVIDYKKVSADGMFTLLGLNEVNGLLQEISERKSKIKEKLPKMKELARKQIFFINSLIYNS